MDLARLRRPLLPQPAAKQATEAANGCLDEGSATSSILLLCAAAIGTGVLALPYGVSCTGFLPAVCIFAVAGSAAYSSNHILFLCAQKTGLGSYGELLTDVLGKSGAMLLDLFVFVEGIGIVATYLIFIMDYMPSVCAAWGDDLWCADRTNVMTVASLIIWPLSCLRGLSALRYVSSCSLVTICITFAVVLAKTPSRFAASGQFIRDVAEEVHLGRGVFQTLAMACFAFNTHTNTPEIARQLRRPTRGRNRLVLCTHTSLLWVMYTIIAVCGFLSFPGSIHQDFLTNYEVHDTLITVCRTLLSLTLVFASPVNFFPAIQALFNILDRLRLSISGRAGTSWYDLHEVRVPVTTACFAVSLGIAIRTPHVADLIGVISTFLSSPIMFAFPALMYWRILGHQRAGIPIALVMLTLSLWVAELLRLLS